MNFKYHALLLCGMLLTAGCSKIGQADDGLGPFQGEWNVVELHENGRPVDQATCKRLTMVFQKGQFNKIEVTPIKILNTDEASVRVDNSKTPKEVDFVHLLGAEQGKTRYGIFEFADSKLKLCLGVLGGPRPTDLVAAPKTTLMVLEPKK